MDKKTIAVIGLVTLGVISGGVLTNPEDTKTVQLDIKPEVSNRVNVSTIDVPNGANRMRISLNRNNWQDLGEGVDVVSVQTSFFDGKQAIPGVGAFTTDGGNRLDGKGEVSTESYNDTPIPPGINRTIQIQITSAIELETEFKVEFYEK